MEADIFRARHYPGPGTDPCFEILRKKPCIMTVDGRELQTSQRSEALQKIAAPPFSNPRISDSIPRIKNQQAVLVSTMVAHLISWSEGIWFGVAPWMSLFLTLGDPSWVVLKRNQMENHGLCRGSSLSKDLPTLGQCWVSIFLNR